MARRRENPMKGKSLMILAGAGVAAYFAYINNWLASVGFPYNAVVNAAASAATGTETTSTPVTVAPPTVAALIAAPPLGTRVSTLGQAQAQAAAKYPYIVPDSATETALVSQGGLPGYEAVITTDAGPVWLRNDVFTALDTSHKNSIARMEAQYKAAGQTPTVQSYVNIANVSLPQIQTLISIQGLSGVGLINARSMFPHNPITASAVGWRY